MDDLNRIMQLKAGCFYCSQIILKMGLDLQGKDNSDLLKAMQALAGGIGFCGYICGALTGGASMLGLYAGKGDIDRDEDERLNLMLLDLTEWFKNTIGNQYHGMNCDEILENDQRNIPSRCPTIVASVFQKCKELLVEYGYELSGEFE